MTSPHVIDGEYLPFLAAPSQDGSDGGLKAPSIIESVGFVPPQEDGKIVTPGGWAYGGNSWQ